MNDNFFDSSASASNLDLSAFFDSDLSEQLCRVLGLGVLVSLGLTRDGGALGIAIFDNGRRRREYFRRSEDASEYLRMATAALAGNGVGRQRGNPPVGQRPTRGSSEPF